MSKVEIKPIKDAPNLKELIDKFGVNEDELIVAYGNVIYSPPKGMSKDLLVHEMVHCERQGFANDSAKRWWELYMSDKKFRLAEEVIAYQKQFQFCCDVWKDRNKRTKILFAMAKELSSEMYGNLCSQLEARLWITGKMKSVV